MSPPGALQVEAAPRPQDGWATGEVAARATWRSVGPSRRAFCLVFDRSASRQDLPRTGHEIIRRVAGRGRGGDSHISGRFPTSLPVADVQTDGTVSTSVSMLSEVLRLERRCHSLPISTCVGECEWVISRRQCDADDLYALQILGGEAARLRGAVCHSKSIRVCTHDCFWDPGHNVCRGNRTALAHVPEAIGHDDEDWVSPSAEITQMNRACATISVAAACVGDCEWGSGTHHRGCLASRVFAATADSQSLHSLPGAGRRTSSRAERDAPTRGLGLGPAAARANTPAEAVVAAVEGGAGDGVGAQSCQKIDGEPSPGPCVEGEDLRLTFEHLRPLHSYTAFCTALDLPQTRCGTGSHVQSCVGGIHDATMTPFLDGADFVEVFFDTADQSDAPRAFPAGRPQANDLSEGGFLAPIAVCLVLALCLFFLMRRFCSSGAGSNSRKFVNLPVPQKSERGLHGDSDIESTEWTQLAEAVI